MGYTWKKLADDWSTLTDTQKEDLFIGTGYVRPTLEELLALGSTFKIAAYSGDSIVPTTYINAVPFDKLFVPNSLFGGTFDSIDSISPKVDIYGGDVVLSHFDTDYSDEVSGSSWVQVGSVPIDTTEKKFGTGSLYFDGTSYIYSSNNKQDFNFYDKDFSIEAWIYPTDNTTRQALFSFSTEYHGVAVDMFYNGTNNINMWFSSDGHSWNIIDADTGTSNGKGIDNMIAMNDWNHIALVRSDNNIILFVNGLVSAMVNVVTTNPIMYFDELDKFNVGAWYNGGYLFKGYLDELRITKGLSHYTSAFTPETSSFSTITNMPRIRFAITKNLIDYYTFDESVITRTSTTDTVTRDVIDMDGTDDMVVIPSTVLGGKREFTVEADIITTDTSSGSSYFDNPAIFGFYTSTASDADFGVQIKNGYLCWYHGFTTDGTDKYGTTSKFVADGNKHNIAVTCDGILINIYVDGELVAKSMSNNIPMALNNMYIGYTSNYCTMKVVEARLWSVARFSKYLGKEIMKTAYGLEAWYLPENIVGATFYDESDNGNNASLTGSPVLSTITETVTTVTETSGFVPITAFDATNVISDGMTAEILDSISETQWDLFFSGSGRDAGIGIAFAIGQDTTKQIANVNDLTIYADMKGEWNSAHKGVDYEYGYPNNNLLRVQLLTDGDYKINYYKKSSSSGGGSTTPSKIAVNWEPNTSYVCGQIVLHAGTMYVVDADFESGTVFSDSNLTSYGGIPLTSLQINAIINAF